SNVEFWTNKIERNRERDLKNRIKLRDMGWHVIQLWECQLKPKVRERNLEGLIYTLNKMMLLNYQAKMYSEYKDTAEELPVAAEETTDYSITT
ncbi:MAG: very short patch repair endonuclease, partial [Bacteroides sp.]|nr:very short patch repair endonuclease [Bacteroides sp.]